MQLSLDDMLPQHLNHKASWYALSDCKTHEIQVNL